MGTLDLVAAEDPKTALLVAAVRMMEVNMGAELCRAAECRLG
jgi:hypothetical protein